MAKSTPDKKRRQQKIAIGGAVLLVVVLAIQVPRTLKMIKGTATPAAAPAAVESSDSAPASTAGPVVSLTNTEPGPSKLPRGAGYGRKDPFAARTAGGKGSAGKDRKGDAGFRLVPGMAVTADTPARRGRYVVVLRSLPAKGGRATALRVAADFRKRGVPHAGVLLSTKYGSLRRGYYVVHAGTYPSRLAALESLLAARRAGADNPYIRPLKA
jgi:hypothetical protein